MYHFLLAMAPSRLSDWLKMMVSAAAGLQEGQQVLFQARVSQVRKGRSQKKEHEMSSGFSSTSLFVHHSRGKGGQEQRHTCILITMSWYRCSACHQSASTSDLMSSCSLAAGCCQPWCLRLSGHLSLELQRTFCNHYHMLSGPPLEPTSSSSSHWSYRAIRSQQPRAGVGGAGR